LSDSVLVTVVGGGHLETTPGWCCWPAPVWWALGNCVNGTAVHPLSLAHGKETFIQGQLSLQVQKCMGSNKPTEAQATQSLPAADQI
jgi:hypothetical protein